MGLFEPSSNPCHLAEKGFCVPRFGQGGVAGSSCFLQGREERNKKKIPKLGGRFSRSEVNDLCQHRIQACASALPHPSQIGRPGLTTPATGRIGIDTDLFASQEAYQVLPGSVTLTVSTRNAFLAGFFPLLLFSCHRGKMFSASLKSGLGCRARLVMHDSVTRHGGVPNLLEQKQATTDF